MWRLKNRCKRSIVSWTTFGGSLYRMMLAVLLSVVITSVSYADDWEEIHRRIVETANRCESSVVSLYLETTPRKLNNLSPFHQGDHSNSKIAPTDPSFLPNQSTLGIAVKNRFLNDETMVLCRISQLFHQNQNPENQRTFASQTVFCRFRNPQNELTTLTLSIYSSDPRSNLAILRVNPADQQVNDLPPPVSLKNAQSINRGSMVIRLGGPEFVAAGKKPTIRHQIVNATERDLLNYSTKASMQELVGKSRVDSYSGFGKFLWTSSHSEDLDATGLIFNLDGDLVGLEETTPFVIRSNVGVIRSFPVNQVGYRLINTLLSGKEVEYGFLGVVPLEISEVETKLKTGNQHRSSCISAAGVISGSPAETAGFKADDLILDINGHAIQSLVDFQREVLLAIPGKVSVIKIWNHRKRRFENKAVSFWKSPTYQAERIVATNPTYPAWRGIHYNYSTSQQAGEGESNLSECLPAVLVTSVAEDSPAVTAGLRAGNYITHVDGTPVRTPQDFAKKTARLKGTASLSIIGGSRIRIGE